MIILNQLKKYSNTICPYCGSPYVIWDPAPGCGDHDLKCERCNLRFSAAETIPPMPKVDKCQYPIITLCGSTRFRDTFMEIQKELTLAGYIVISVGCFGHYETGEDVKRITENKEMLDAMHKRKIDMAEAIYVINPGGYIGDSTASEIKYAREHYKKVYYLIPPKEEK